jgi:transposase
MEITEAQYRKIEPCLPTQRGNVTLDNLYVLNAILYVAEQGVQMAWSAQAVRQLAHDLYSHESLVEERGAGSRICTVATHADHPREDRSRRLGPYHRHGPSGWHGGVKKNGPQAIGQSRGGWTTKIHLVAADARTAITVALSPGQAHDAPEGRKLLQRVGRMPRPIPRLMDRAYEGDATRQLAVDLGYLPVVPPKPNRLTPWAYDRAMYTRRNEIDRLFRRLKGFRRIFSRFEKLDGMFVAFINFALIVDGLR